MKLIANEYHTCILPNECKYIHTHTYIHIHKYMQHLLGHDEQDGSRIHVLLVREHGRRSDVRDVMCNLRTYIYKSIHTHIYTYIHLHRYIHIYIHTSNSEHIHTYLHTYIKKT